MKLKFFNRPLRILLATNAMILVAVAMLGPIYALFVEEIGGDLLDAAFTGGIFALAAGLTTLVAGRYIDKVKRDELIVVLGYVVVGVSFFLYTQVSSIMTLFMVQILIGFGEAIYSPAFDTLYTRHITAAKAGREWGAWESVNYLSMAVGAFVGGFVVHRFGFNALFIIMGTLSLLSAAYVYNLPKRTL